MLFTVVSSLAAQALWAGGRTVDFEIPAGDFSQSVIQFYKQSNVEILYASVGSIGEVRTQPVKGTFDVETALRKMLEGTGFTFDVDTDHSFLLRRVDAAAPANSAVLVASPAASADGEVLGTGTAEPVRLASAELQPLQDVVVTGTYLHGVADIMSPLVKVDRQQMKSTAYATVQDALQALTFNSGGGPSDDFSGSDGNYNRGTGPDLRGLGYGATLVLINGRRQPMAGSEADFVDTSNIPWSAVDRIEVLPDGTSALYGSDAIAGVVNIIMRDSLVGAETLGRFANATGGSDETMASQQFGHHWDSGNLFFSYQYSERTALPASSRYYTANEDKRSLGGADHRSLWGNPGNLLDPVTGEPVPVPLNQDGTALTTADFIRGQPNLTNKFATYDLTPKRQMHSVYATLSQQLSDHVQLYTDNRFGIRRSEQSQFAIDQLLEVPDTNAFYVNPFSKSAHSVNVAYSFIEDLGPPVFEGETRSYDGAIGIKAEHSSGWREHFYVSYGEEDLRWTEKNIPDLDALARIWLPDRNPETAFNPFGDGSHTSPATIAAIRSSDHSRVLSQIRGANLVADGPVLSLPTGTVRLAIGAERRRESLSHQLSAMNNPEESFSRDISSVFTEASIPLIGSRDDERAAPRLELSLAGRYERYSDFGSTYNPKVAMRWMPREWLKLRGSWGNSFKAPRLLDLYDTSQNATAVLLFPDPKSMNLNNLSMVVIRQGNNSKLHEETARTWTLGIDLAPPVIPQLTVSATYFNVNYEGRVLRPGPPNPAEILFQEAQWAPVIYRQPSPALLDDACAEPALFEVAGPCHSDSVAAVIDFRLKNLAITRTRGIDLKIDYSADTRLGTFDFGLMGSHIFGFDQALTRVAPVTDVLDVVGYPLGTRIRGHIDWSEHGADRSGFSLGLTLDHTGGYKNSVATVQHVDSLTTADVRIAYRTPTYAGRLANLEIVLNAVNVFDQAPPFVDTNFGYDVSNADPIGRVIGFYVGKNW